MFVVIDSRGTERGLQQPVNEAIVRAAIAVTLAVEADNPVITETLTEMQLYDCTFGDGQGRVFKHLYTADEARLTFGRRVKPRANVRTPGPIRNLNGKPASLGMPFIDRTPAADQVSA